MVLALLLACADPVPAPAADSADPVAAFDLPTHNECRPAPIPAAVCLALVEEDGRYPTVPEDHSLTDPVADDPRVDDPELAWLKADLSRCACACCHTAAYGGPGAYFWALDWSPVWIDSASSWSIGVLLGETEDPDRTLPLGDRDRANAILNAERDRRRAAD